MRRLSTIGLVMWSATFALGATAQDGPILPPPPPMSAEDPSSATNLFVVGPGTPVPRNGLFLFWMSPLDEFPEDQRPDPFVQVSRVEGGSTRTFSGSLRKVVDSYWAWKPSEPLDPGPYLVSIAHNFFGTSSATITVVDDVVLEPPGLTGEPVAATATMTTRQAYCHTEGPEHSFDAPLFATHERTSVFVEPEVTFTAVPEIANQFLYRLFTSRFDLISPFRAFDALQAAGPFLLPADEYCFHVEAMDIATSTVHAVAGLELCAPHHAGIGELGERALPITDDQLSRYACSFPPEGYEKRWCQINDQCIELWENEGLIDVNACRQYFEACPDAKRPDAGTMNGSGGAGGRIDLEPEDAGASDVPIRPESDAGADAAAGGGGCGCSTVHATEQAPLLGGLVLGLVALARGRRRAYCRGVASTHASSAR